ncbi:MAG: SseB family protein [Gemmobacter sp.]|uniref:SseB family protein n=1 Tax=Gemmobacter sp. TaxID=1898957 RepID=UPI00391B9492
MSLLDAAHAAMLADPEDDLARLRYYRTLADSDLCLMLAEEPQGDTLTPRVFALEDGPVVLVFDTEERLAGFSSVPVPYAVLPGRVVVARMAGQGIGLGVNLSAPEAAWLMAPHAVDWLAGVLETAPAETRGRPVAIHSPGPLDPALSEALAFALSGAGGLAAAAVLAQVAWADGARGLMLAFVGADAAAEAPLSRALAEALAFSGFEGGAVDLAFLAADDALVRSLMALGQPLTLPAPPAAPPERAPPPPPGMNPDRPPRLR